jgi:hypothetical protein
MRYISNTLTALSSLANSHGMTRRNSPPPIVIPALSPEQRQGLKEFGIPLPIFDPEKNTGYVLLEARVAPDPVGGFLASVERFPVLAGGDSPEEALLALSVILRSSLTL